MLQTALIEGRAHARNVRLSSDIRERPLIELNSNRYLKVPRRVEFLMRAVRNKLING